MGDDTTRVNLAVVSEQVNQVKSTVDEIKADQTVFCNKMEEALMGDPADRSKPGMIGRIRANEDAVESNAARIKQIFGFGKWFAGIISSVVTGVVLFFSIGKGK